MKESKLKSVVTSSNLDAYKLSKDIRAVLDRADKMRSYMLLGGKTPPNELRLFRNDWNKINNAVIEQSDKKFSAATVFYSGLPIIPHNDSPKPFNLEAAA